MTTTDEDLQKKQKNVEDLRQKVVDATAKRETKERELVNDITAKALDAEAVSLEARLAVEAAALKLVAKPVEEAPAAAPFAPAAITK